MSLVYSHITPDDGYFKLYNTEFPYQYDTLYKNIKNNVYHCDGYSVNSRHSGIFTTISENVGNPFCKDWEYIPQRYVYQEMPVILKELMVIAQNICRHHKLTEAIVNVYGHGDFIAYHKDYHEENKKPIAVMCSFEQDKDTTHTLEFYRTLDDPKTTRKDRSDEGYSLFIPLKNNSVAIMDGMQRRYVHALHPGKKRISVVFR
tara:strand:+ start:189 stop:797 length:609 start_codon:yes stop_codon:yes gene_type:complete